MPSTEIRSSWNTRSFAFHFWLPFSKSMTNETAAPLRQNCITLIRKKSETYRIPGIMLHESGMLISLHKTFLLMDGAEWLTKSWGKGVNSSAACSYRTALSRRSAAQLPVFTCEHLSIAAVPFPPVTTTTTCNFSFWWTDFCLPSDFFFFLSPFVPVIHVPKPQRSGGRKKESAITYRSNRVAIFYSPGENYHAEHIPTHERHSASAVRERAFVQ